MASQYTTYRYKSAEILWTVGTLTVIQRPALIKRDFNSRHTSWGITPMKEKAKTYKSRWNHRIYTSRPKGHSYILVSNMEC